MFKLESYITPIILNHVAKYVKNIRPEDSQVSLWEGEVAFQNLDLRLDVLEEELNLPFEFLSGHIHELSIQVPWLKITSEPIKITINTIEFVLKLKDVKTDTNPSPKKTEKKKRISKVEEQQQQGYMPGLVNKIINNIVINCHNIILKYVEEDIVVSMNIQLLSLNSADETWKPAFTDIHPIKVFMRKLIQVSDLTICLDKRNAAGQIDVCQEPILYRCSLEIRVVRKYNVTTLHIGSITKIGIFTKVMEMNVSSLQFPMAMRLFKLILALKGGELKSRSSSDLNEDETERDQESVASVPSSLLNWAWNLIPNLSLSEVEDEERFESNISGQQMEIGVYIEALNFTLKSSEFITDSIVGATKKIRYTPIVRLSLGGLYSETMIIADKNWSNTKAGCSYMSIEPLDSYRDDESDIISLVVTPTMHNRTFLDRSLFDETFIEKDWIVTSYDDYSVRVTEEYLLYRSPVFAFDLVEYKENVNPDSSESEVETDSARDRVVYRILASKLTLRYSQTYARLANVLQELIRAYDYPPYSDDKPETSNGSPKLHPPLLDDFDSLMNGIPLKVYKFNLSSIKFEFHPRTEHVTFKPSKKLSVTSKKALPCFKVLVDNIEGQWTTPIDPDKLVHTTCQLPDKPAELLNACYENAQVNLKNISLTLNQELNSSELCTIPKASINFGDLLQSSLWKNEDVPVRKLEVVFESIILEFSKMQLTTALQLSELLMEFDSEKLRKITNQTLRKENNVVKIRSQFKKLDMEMKKYRTTTMYRGSLKALQAITLRPDSTRTQDANNILLTTITNSQRKKWLDCYMQIPNECAQGTCTKSVVALWTEEYHLHVNEDLVDFLKFIEPQQLYTKDTISDSTAAQSRPPLMKQSSKKSTNSERQARRICCPEETIHLSSERDEKISVEKNRGKELQEQFCYSKMLQYIKNMIIKVKMVKGNVTVTSGPNQRQPRPTTFTQITLPKIVFNSSLAENINRYNIQNEFQTNSSKSVKDTFPWSCGICDFSIQSSYENFMRPIVHPIQTAVTVAMTHKKETLILPKTESQQQPKPAEELKQGKSDLSMQQSQNSDNEIKSEEKSMLDSSVSAIGRSVNSDENDQSSKTTEKKRSYLQEAVGTVFQGKRRPQRDVVSVSVHVDTSPIYMEFEIERMELLHDHLNLLMSVISLLQSPENKPSIENHKMIKIVTNNEEDTKIKQFMEMETNSETSMLTADKPVSKFSSSVLFQWTFTKFTIELDAQRRSKCKLAFDMEDIITSLDKRDEFTKFTFKIGTMNMRFFEADGKNVLVPSDRLKIKVQSDSTQSPLFNMVITSVGIINFLKKIGAKRKDVDPLRTISEVVVKMEAIEIILDMDKLAILTPAVLALMSKEDSSNEVKLPSMKNSAPCTAYELPMIHLESKGITVYLPAETSRTWCSVFIFKIDAINISSNLENPLQRSPIRVDVFQKAAQLGILGIPGSMIEDRQYEITLQNMSAATGNWNEILTYMKEHSDNFHSTNPAFEWNNQSRKTSLDIRKIFSNFTFITIYAPCITCNNVLICGQAIEFNCSSDLIISLTTDQVGLISSTCGKLQTIIGHMEQSSNPVKTNSKTTKPSDSDISLRPVRNECVKCNFTVLTPCARINKDSNPQASDESSEKPTTDSGISLEKKSVTKKSTKASLANCQQSCVRLMPHTTTFVAGMFIINLYKYIRNIHGIPQGDEISIEEILKPLISITVSQPSFLASQSIYEATQRFSLFSITVNLYHIKDMVAREQQSTPHVLFHTGQGEVDSSGIPPPLLVMNSRTTKSGKVEVDINFSKPMAIRLSRNSFESLTKHTIRCCEALLEIPCLNLRTEKPLIRATKIQTIKNMFFNADHFNCKLNMISLKFFEKDVYSMKVTVVDLRLNTKFQTRPEKVNAKGSIGGIYMQSNRTITVHPIGIKCNMDLIQEPWNRLPIVTANIKFNFIHCDIGMEFVRNCSRASKVVNEEINLCNNLWQKFIASQGDRNNEQMNRDRLIKLQLPPVESRISADPKDEFYQDDLRAGAFQFVEMDSDALLPMPYQIQIIKKNFGIICWRYPQPRKMAKIHVFPVPMPSSNPIRIKCRMEYFSDVHEGFLHYCDFWLSETVSKPISLPNQEITATIWRVVILQSLVSINQECFDSTEDDEDLRSIISIGIDDILNSARKESDFILHPKVLVGCMRIDTVFQPSAIPKIQLVINLNEMRLNLQNIQNIESNLPTNLKKLKLAENYKPINETFLSLCIEKANVHSSFHGLKNFSVHSELIVSIKCLDYGYLNLIYIMEPTSLTGAFCLNSTNGTMFSNIDADKLTLQLGPSILHNLMCAKQNWQSYFDAENELQTFIISKFIVGNRTNSNITFGQTGTDERILLQSRECCKYSFQSDKFTQELTFYLMEMEQTELASNSLVITLEFPENSDRKVNHVAINNKCLAIQTRKLSATQYYILIKGQIEIISMVRDSFLMEFYENGKRSEHEEVEISDKVRRTLLQPVTFDSDICIRLKFNDVRGKGQTGNIPLKANKNYPWLVKVPTNSPEKFISYWVRVIRECIPELRTDTFHPQKILIVIWPIFEICSMLTNEISGQESSTKEYFSIRPFGRCHQLSVPATHQTVHKLTFNDSYKSAPEFNLTLEAIDWNKFFWYDEDLWTVENALSELAKPTASKWPIFDEEELRVRRQCVPNCETTLLYKCSLSRELSCTLCLEISPWGTFINASGLKIVVDWKGADEPLEIASNSVAMLPQIKSEFTLKILCGLSWVSSLPIVFDNSPDYVKRKCYRINENNGIDIVMLSCDQIFQFYFKFCTENERNIFIFQPKYVVINMSQHLLTIYPFVLDPKGTVTRKEIQSLTNSKKYVLPKLSTSEYCVGACVDGFSDLQIGKTLRCPDTAFTFFVCIQLKEKSEISIPIALTMPFNRKCFSVQLHEKSFAFSASLLEKNGQYFLSFFEDSSPTMLISNETDLTLIIAQTNTEENAKVSNTISEYDGKHFEWHQIIRPKSELYYTPPTSYLNFPDVDPSTYKICIALYIENQNKKNIKWSKAINTDASWEKFLHLPAQGDVKLIVCDKHRITRVWIHYIAQQLEFSVKELRSRLLTPQPNDTPECSKNSSQAQNNSIDEPLIDEPLQRVKPTPSSLCIHHSPGTSVTPNSPFKVKFTIKEINVKIFVECKTVDYLKKEIFALYINDFYMTYENTRRTLKLLLSNLQIDNQLFSSGNYDFPVILCSQEPYKRFFYSCPNTNSSHALEMVSPGLAEATVCFYDDEMKVRSIACRVNPIRAYIEDTYLNDLLDYLVDCTPSNIVVSLVDSDFYVDVVPGEFLIPKDIVAQAVYLSEPLRMQYFRIDAINVLLSVHTCVRLYIALDHSPLQFSTYERRDVLTLPLRFGHTLGMHYLSGALFGAGWVVGSLEMLGSPSGLARSFSVGLKDFVSMPVRGLLRGPWGFVVGVAQGSASLLRNITAGTLNSVSKLAASVSRNLDRLTLDQEHIQRTEALRRCRPQGFAEGFAQGITGLGISILGAVGGIARHTLEARSPGQVVAGMGKGIVGAFAKPISGAAELVALTGQGVLHTVGFNAMPQQRMPSAPRNIAAQVSELKIWNLLVGVLSSVLEGDQILFYHDVTLNRDGTLCAGSVFLTSSILALFEFDQNRFSFITPTQRLEASIDPNDKALVNISVKKLPNELEQGSFYTTQRIMTFLRASNNEIGMNNTTTESLDDMLRDHRYKNRSLYISEYLAQYLVEYIRIINMKRS